MDWTQIEWKSYLFMRHLPVMSSSKFTHPSSVKLSCDIHLQVNTIINLTTLWTLISLKYFTLYMTSACDRCIAIALFSPQKVIRPVNNVFTFLDPGIPGLFYWRLHVCDSVLQTAGSSVHHTPYLYDQLMHQGSKCTCTEISRTIAISCDMIGRALWDQRQPRDFWREGGADRKKPFTSSFSVNFRT